MIESTQEKRETVGFDLGNTTIRISFGSKSIAMHNSVLLEKGNAFINKKPNNTCLMDLHLLLTLRY